MSRAVKKAKSGWLRAPLLGVIASAVVMSTASAQSQLLLIEFNEDDQPGFDLWPGGLAGSLLTGQFGSIRVDVSTNTSFAMPVNRGSVNGNPAGYTYQNLYEDLLHAFTPTGTMTFDVSGLTPNQQYTFTLYAWDPGSATGIHEWTVTGGTGVPPVITVDWSVPLINNDTFALVFDITTDSNGAFQVDNTAGLQGSAVNGFKLEGSLSVGSNYCGPAVVNSTGGSASMSASGSTLVANNDLTLITDGMPLNSFGFFLTSTSQGFVTNPGGSQGNLCLGGAIGRYVGPGQVQNSGSSGGISLVIDNSMHPTPTGLVQVVAGETWNFTAWFRDSNGMGGATSNFSDGLEVLFV